MKKTILMLAAGAALFASCQNNNSATQAATNNKTPDNVKTALAIEDAIVKKDVEGVYKYCAKDFVDYGNGEMKAVTNVDSLKLGMKQFMDAFPDLKVDNMKTIAQGDTVVVLGDWSGTFKKDFMGIKATNKSFKAPDADVFVFNKDGQLVVRHSVQSEATYFAQLGIQAPPSTEKK